MHEPKRILITGATAGIGRATTRALVKEGHEVFATGRSQEALAGVAAELDHPDNLTTLCLDVTDQASIEAAATAVMKHTAGAGIDVLINNAGYGLSGPVEVLSDEDLRAQFDTNVFGLMAVIRAFVKPMRERQSGRILNISSVGGRITFPFLGAYHASKYALEALSNALRIELGPFGIEVVLIEPGPIKTEFSDRALRTVSRYRHAGSPYEPIFERAEKLQSLSDQYAVGPEHVVRAILRAIGSRRPRARYVAPCRSQIMLAAFAVLPTRLMDAIIRAGVGLTPKSLGLKSQRAP